MLQHWIQVADRFISLCGTCTQIKTVDLHLITETINFPEMNLTDGAQGSEKFRLFLLHESLLLNRSCLNLLTVNIM